ncbi:hypothetical protein E2C01_091986 [Portunus trituberculatus]|uniref:Uncharacterized protein n=1 Tax=Portunus trituberculatus TaxID=210409 RepID=A0A5B7JFE0_PORTR|nr:hypothetical protein [Portunus trituberculatus]
MRPQSQVRRGRAAVQDSLKVHRGSAESPLPHKDDLPTRQPAAQTTLPYTPSRCMSVWQGWQGGRVAEKGV